MEKRPVVLMILDGYGLNDNCEANAVCEGKTPIMDQLMSQCPFVKGQASGLAVGLPDGQMGNSEVGHLNMGAGRIVYQELTRITKSIEDGDFFSNEALMAAVENCKKNDSALHMFGLVSDGPTFTDCWSWPRETVSPKFMYTASWMAAILRRLPVRSLWRLWSQR